MLAGIAAWSRWGWNILKLLLSQRWIWCAIVSIAAATTVVLVGNTYGPQWAIPTATLIVAAIAVFQPWIHSWLRYPILRVNCAPTEPYVHAAARDNGVRAIFFTIRVSNAGNTIAEAVEVIANRVWRVEGKDRKAVDDFLPMRLRLAFSPEALSSDIPRGAFRHFNMCSIDHAIERAANEAKQDAGRPKALPAKNTSSGAPMAVVFRIEVSPASNVHPEVLDAADGYELELLVASKNARLQRVRFSLNSPKEIEQSAWESLPAHCKVQILD